MKEKRWRMGVEKKISEKRGKWEMVERENKRESGDKKN